MYLVKLDDIGVPKYFEDADLSGDSLYVCLFNNFLFLEGFDSHLHLCRSVDPQSDFPKCPLAYGLS